MDSIKFLGTAGARFAVSRQIRKSGGIWLTLDDTNILIDPGPGSLVRCISSKPPLDPQNLDAILLSHKHIDHSNDVNIMIEAMTNGGHHTKGVVFAPSDALDIDPVILHHFRNHVKKIISLKGKKTYSIGSIKFSTSCMHVHDVETYGFTFHGKQNSVSYISDTKYFKDLENCYSSDVVIFNVVLKKPKEFINHLSIEDVEYMIQQMDLKLAIITHFGLTMIKEKPWKIAEKLSKTTGIPVIAASDGLHLILDDMLTKSH